MKKLILLFLFASIALNGFSKTWTVLSSGMTYSPATLTINQGDSVKFTIDASHNAVEVSQTVWNANGTTSNNGFSIPFGGGTVLPAKLAVGTHYYVCTPHASFGMKGRIIVQTATRLDETKTVSNVVVYTNPASKLLNVQLNVEKLSTIEIKLIDIQGKLVTTILPKTPVVGLYAQSFGLSTKMAPGIYVIQLKVGTATSFHKVVFQ